MFPPGYFTVDRLEVEGYVRKLFGKDFVVHRSLAKSKRSEAEPKTPRLSKTYWTVTEPRTGHAVCEGTELRTKTIRAALTAAEDAIAREGGPASVDHAVERVLAAREVS